ncbi:MAG TPA: glycine oxidase ThiO [Myxococcota bacterium]
MSAQDSKRIVVVGAGLLGLAAAAELARRGHRVTVLERAVPGAEASTAAAGILGPQLEHDDDGPTLDLGVAGARATLALADVIAREVPAHAHLDVMKRGALKIARSDDEARALSRRAAWQTARGLRAHIVDETAARALVPALGDGVALACVFPDDHCLDPRAYGPALLALALHRGVALTSGVPVVRMIESAGRVAGVVLANNTRVDADVVLVCAGAWSSRVPDVQRLAHLQDHTVHPVRGQMLELAAPNGDDGGGAVDRVIYGAGGYLVPRGDGRVVVGSTTEPSAGFDKSVTAAGVQALLARALTLVPSLGERAIARTWAGLRPSTSDGLPLIGAAHAPGLWLSTGHYRNGVLLAAISAEIVGALIDNERPSLDVAPFSPKRLHSSA